MGTVTSHPVLSTLLAAANGSFPKADGQAVLVPALPGGFQAVVSFTGHALIATELQAGELRDLRLDGFGSSLQPAVLQRLAGPCGVIGTVDVTLVARGLGGGRLPRRTDLADHPRVRHAQALRQDVRVYGDGRGLITLASGVAGRLEVSVEVERELQGTGEGRRLIGEALKLVPAHQPFFAAVSPGNARSLRAFLAVGFRPLASEALIKRRPA